MPKESNLGFNVGIFVLMAIIGVTVFIFSISDSSLFAEGKMIKTVFEFANGIKKNAPVRIAGVDQGIVRDIVLFHDRQDGKTKVEIHLWVMKDARIPSDSMVTINQLGLMGEKYIEIIPGKDLEDFMQVGKFYRGKDPISQEAISQRVLEVANKLEYSIAGFNSIVHDEGNRESLQNILYNLNSTTGRLDSILGDISAGKGTVGKLLSDDSLYTDMQDLSADLKENPWKLLRKPKKSRKDKDKDED